MISFGFSKEQDQTVYLTLQSSVHRALRDNNQIQLSNYGLNKAQWDNYQAWSQLLPTIQFSTRYMHIDDQTLAERDFRIYLPPELSKQIPQTVFQESYYSAIDVSVPLFNGAVLNGIRIANANKIAADKMNESTINTTLFQVISSYLNVLKTQELLRLQENFTNLTKLNFEKAQRQESAGRFSKNEVLFWEIDYQKQQSALTSAESNLRTTKSVLTNLLDLDIDTKIEVEYTIPNTILEESDKIEQMSDDEILNMINLNESDLLMANAALAMGRSQKQIGKLLYKNTQASFLPSLNFGYTYAWRENNTLKLDDYSPETYMINLSVPLFTSFQNLSKTRSAYFEYQQNVENYEDQLNNIQFVLSETVNKIINLKTQRRLSQMNVIYSENNYRIIEQQKDNGVISNLDFINTKLDLQNSELADINNQYDFISAIVELYYLLGKLDIIVDIN
ncbi:MAG: TolC family protein [Fidelibacterota bacterium]